MSDDTRPLGTIDEIQRLNDEWTVAINAEKLADAEKKQAKKDRLDALTDSRETVQRILTESKTVPEKEKKQCLIDAQVANDEWQERKRDFDEKVADKTAAWKEAKQKVSEAMAAVRDAITASKQGAFDFGGD